MELQLRNPDLLHVKTQSGISIGGSQEWYPDHWQRMSGCAPTTAANQMWYLSQAHTELSSLFNVGDATQERYVALQIKLFNYITPSRPGGTNTSTIFTNGAVKYGKEHGISLLPHVLEIPMPHSKRPQREDVREFFAAAFHADCPIAFMNLSNGNQSNLDSWHWVTIISIDLDSMVTEICDQGSTLTIDFWAWLKSSLLGGALVYLTF